MANLRLRRIDMPAGLSHVEVMTGLAVLARNLVAEFANVGAVEFGLKKREIPNRLI